MPWRSSSTPRAANFHFSTHASHSELHAHLRIARGFRKPRTEFFLRAESFFNVATNIQQMDDEPGLGGRVIDAYGGRLYVADTNNHRIQKFSYLPIPVVSSTWSRIKSQYMGQVPSTPAP